MKFSRRVVVIAEGEGALNADPSTSHHDSQANHDAPLGMTIPNGEYEPPLFST
jgi:hypothetical protein